MLEQAALKELNAEFIKLQERSTIYQDDVLQNYEIRQVQSNDEAKSILNDSIAKLLDKSVHKELKVTKKEKPLRTLPNYKSLLKAQENEEKKEKDIWYHMKKKFKNKLKYSNISYNLNHKNQMDFSKQEIENAYFSQYIPLLSEKELKDPKKGYILKTIFYENVLNGDKYLQVNSYNIINHNENKNDDLCVLQVLFYKFCTSKFQFILQSVFLHDIFQGYQKFKEKFPDQQHPTMQNSILNVGQNSYFFLKNIGENDEKCLQLNVHKLLSYQSISTLEESVSMREINNLQEKKIVLPDDFEGELGDFVTGFLKDATQSSKFNSDIDEEEFLEDQFVFVQTWNSEQSFLIYSIRNLSKPLVRFDDYEIEQIEYGYFTRLDNKKIIFTLKSQKTNYQIEVIEQGEIEDEKKEKSVNLGLKKDEDYDIDEDPNIQITNFNSVQFNYYTWHTQYDPLFMKILDEKSGKTINQSYFISYQNSDLDAGKIQLIYPQLQKIEVDEEENEKNPEQKSEINQEPYVFQQIRKKHKIQNNSKAKFILLFNQKINFQDKNEKVIDLLQRCGLIERNPDSILCKNDIIICMKESIVEVFYFEEERSSFQFAKTLSELKSHKNYNLLSRAIQNFEFKFNKKREIYQDNYKMPYKNLDQYTCYNKDESAENLYLNRSKKGIFTTHCRAFIKNKEFKFDQRKLLIDLSQNQKEESPFKLLNLYAPSIEQIKLVKYHRSESNVIFFFLYRQNQILCQNLIDSQDDPNDWQYGVHFFVIKSIQDLKLIVKQEKSLIEFGTVVFIPMELDNIIIDSFQANKFYKYEGDIKSTLRSSTDIQFELIRDLNQPLNSYFPFIFNNKYNNERGFDHYLCFINIDKVAEQMEYLNLEDEPIDFENCIHSFKIEYYQSMHEHSNMEKVSYGTKCFRNYVPSLAGGRSSNMLCMSTNWQKKYGINGNFEGYQAIFQIGTNLQFSNKGIEQIEIREYLVNISADENKQNPIQACPIQLKHATFSSQYQEKVYSHYDDVNWDFWAHCSDKYPIENNKLIPNIDDEGQIQSTFALINYYQSHHGVYKISKDLESLKEEICPEDYKSLKKFQGQEIHICRVNENDFDGYLMNRRIIQNLDFEILEEYQEQTKYNEDLTYQEFLAKNRSPQFLYDILDLRDLETKNQIAGPYSKSVVSEFYLEENMQMKIFMTSTQLSKDCILNGYFNEQQSIYELYEFQKNILCMSIFDNKELFVFQEGKQKSKYFQPRQILNGKNLCSIQMEYKDVQIKTLKEVFEAHSSQLDFQFIENSVIDKASVFLQKEKKQIFLDALNIDHYFSFQTNFLSSESIFQKAIQQNKFKVVSSIIEFFQQNDHCKYQQWIAINQNLPQLLFSTKFQFSDFFDVDAEEQKQNLESQNEQSLFNNFWISIEEQDLHKLGQKQTKSFLFKQFNSPFGNLDIINKQYQEENLKWAENESDNQDQVAIEHFMLNFQHTIRKIKVDLICGREASETEFTEYLDNFDKNNIKDIKGLDELFIADIIIQNSENNQFLNFVIIRSMIDLMSEKTKKIIKYMTQFYVFGFYFPFLYNIFVINSNDFRADDENETVHVNFMRFLYMIMMFTQIVFAVFELAEIKHNGIVSYLSEGWNYFDSTQPIFYSILLYIKFFNLKFEEYNYQKLQVQIIQIILLIQSSVKVLQYIRVSESFCYLVLMLTQVQIDLLPFMTVFIVCIFVFALILIIMGADGDVESGDYLDLPIFLRIMIQSFRISLGDVVINQYGEKGWGNTSNKDPDFLSASFYAKFIIWMFWIANLYFMLIIMLNFLIAEVSQTYEKVKSQGLTQIYRQKAELNKIVFQILKFFGLLEQFEVIAFQQVQNIIQNSEDEYLSITEKVNTNTVMLINKLKMQIYDKFNMFEKKVEKQFELLKQNSSEQNQQQEILQEVQNISQKFKDETQNLNTKIDGISKEFYNSTLFLLEQMNKNDSFLEQINKKDSFLEQINENDQ